MSVDLTTSLAGLVPPQPPEPTGDVRQAAEQFEALLLQQILEQMPMPGLEGTQAGTMMSFFHEALAKELVEAGGVGLADALEQGMQGRVAPTRSALHHLPLKEQAGGATLTSGFGWRTDPFDGTRHHHDGLDLSAPMGTTIVAADAGRVRFAGKNSGYGNVVIVEHADGTESRYAHCSSLGVVEGDLVTAGQAIAKVGSTGRSTGPHLHFEVRKDGIPIDPREWGTAAKARVDPIRENP
ncbi:MAG: peptidoglycan DD-metalloendopeptidase family protein [Myxococcales bacterium]|nr:peptidoglycan DD-metalloendopeptidase family protein [Myxococcales bacterium]